MRTAIGRDTPHRPVTISVATVAVWALAFAFVALAAACDRGSRAAAQSGSSSPSRTLRVNQGSDILSMDPYFKLESPSFNIQRNLYDPLTDTDALNRLVPCLSQAWRNESPTRWVFELRRDVRFHDGQPFTAADAVYSLRRALDWPPSRLKSEIQTIRDVTALDDHTLRIDTLVPDAILPLRLASVLILDRETCEPAIAAHGDAWLATHVNGTGPYRLESWRKDDVCTLIANPAYWGGAPALARMAFVATANDATRMAALERGDIDILVNVPARFVGLVERMPRYRVVKRPSTRLMYLGLDCGRERSPGVPGSPPNPLRDLRVRRAMALAIRNDLIVRTIMSGNAEPADQLFPPGVIGYDPAIAPLRHDLDEARRLLAEAGYPRGFDVRLDGPNDRYVNDARILTAVAQELARVGIRVAVNAQPKARFFSDDEQGKLSFYLIGWANTNGDGVGTFDHLLHTMDPARNLGAANTSTQYSNPELDALCERASAEFDPARRAAILQQANRLAMRDLPHIPLHFQSEIYAIRKDIDWTPRMETQVRGVDVGFSPTKGKQR